MILNKVIIFNEKILKSSDLSKVVSCLSPLLDIKTCILLNGDLAAGKTTFVKLFCESYGLKNISSPTFSIHQVYKNEKITIDHFDLYRLQNSDEIETSGLWDVFSQQKGLVFIEWSERIPFSELPLDWKLFEVHLSKTDGANNDLERNVVVSSYSLS